MVEEGIFVSPRAKFVLDQALEVNTHCCDCGNAKPAWVGLVKVSSSTISAFCCYQCSAHHRTLGSAVSKVKSVTLDEWSPQEIEWVEATVSNATVNAILEGGGAGVVAKFKPKKSNATTTNNNDAVRKEFIRKKYAEQVFFNRFALQDFLLKGGICFLKDNNNNNAMNGFDNNAFADDDDLFDDSKTTTSDLFGHCTKTGGGGKASGIGGGNTNFMGVMEEGEESGDEGGNTNNNNNTGFAAFGDVEPAPFDPFGESAFSSSTRGPAPVAKNNDGFGVPPPATDAFGVSTHTNTQDDVFGAGGSKHSHNTFGAGGSKHSSDGFGGGGGNTKSPSLDDAFGQFTPPLPNSMSGGGSVSQSVSGNPDITNTLIKRLEAEKKKAVAEEDYVKAAELKHQIELERLVEEKKQAVAAEDYIRAAELKAEIDKYKLKTASKSRGGGVGRNSEHTSTVKQSLNNFLTDNGEGEEDDFATNNNSRRSRRSQSYHTHHDDKSVQSFGEASYSGSPRKPPRHRRDSAGTRSTSYSAPQENEVDDFGLKAKLEGSIRSRGSYTSVDDGMISPAGSLKSKISVQSAPPDAWMQSPQSSMDHHETSPGPKSPRLPPTSRSSRSSRPPSSSSGGSGSRRPARRNVDRQHSNSSRDDDDMFLREENGGSGRRRSSRGGVERHPSNSSFQTKDEEYDNNEGRGSRSSGGGGGSSRRRTVDRHSSASSRDDDEMFLDKPSGSGGRGRRGSMGGGRSSGGGDDRDRQRRRSKSASGRRRRPPRSRGNEPSRNTSHMDGDEDDDEENDSGRRDGSRSGLRKPPQLEAY